MCAKRCRALHFSTMLSSCSAAGLQAPEAATTLANFRNAPESLTTRVPVALSDTATLIYTIQEAPGCAHQLPQAVQLSSRHM